MAVLRIAATVGPPRTFCTATLLIPYSIAWRTPSLPIAPLLLGLRRLNTTYGSVLLPGQARNFGSCVDSRVGISLGTMPVSSGRSYWCRLASVDCFHAGFCIIVIDRLGTYEVIWYGPSEIVCWSSCRLFGTYLSYSSGRAEEKGIASM